MIFSLSKLKRVIKRALKVRARPTSAPGSRRARLIRLLLFGGAILITGLLYPRRDLFSPLNIPRSGDIAHEDFIAPTVITLKKSLSDLVEERDLAINSQPLVLDYDTTVVDSALGQLRHYMLAAQRIRDSLEIDSLDDVGVFAELLSIEFPYVSSVALRETYLADSLQSVYSDLAKILRRDIYFTGVLQSLSVLEKAPRRSIVIRISGREALLTHDKALDLSRAREKLLSELNKLSREKTIHVELRYEVGRHFIFSNLRLNTEEILRRENEALRAVSEIKDQVVEGDLVVRRGQVITSRQVELLEEYATAVHRLNLQENVLKAYLPLLARLFLIAVIFGLLYLYLKLFREDMYRSMPKLFAALSIVGLELLGVYFCESYRLNIYLYPVALAPILFGALFDTRFGVVSSLFIGLLLGALGGFDYGLTLFAVTVGSIGAYSVAGVRQRTQLFKVMFNMAVVGSLLVLIMGVLRSVEYGGFTDDLLACLIGAIATPIIAAAVLPFIESLFGFSTDITLLELSDLNRPLLKRLALEAPGTFHHSIVVGSLAEAAAKTIGGNSLLARVGAYYHDIGKMEIAEYFIENQAGLKSKHDSITPTMSAIILASHVKRGRQMAEEADLPDQVMNFIDEHHGTMIMSFFYNRALEQGASEEVESEFRYPGPRPQTKETAILMLADGVEAASRTLEDPKPARINSLAQKIIDERYHSGQLEESSLTLSDLAHIREAFVKILTGVFHHRVSYPSVKIRGRK